ncbi:lipopolysaccharide biosynthesis protein [Rossellomorea aquimaris]|uniref:lipopolysaccharide biosynthesis protein n=1 Tax=Rossellomorea aquimaris TaxID=189382 RepID=UPI0037CBB93B
MLIEFVVKGSEDIYYEGEKKVLKNLLIKKNKRIFSDMFINIIATILPVLLIQFVILPIVAQKYDEYNYGLALTLISLITLSVQSFTVSLNNTRLLLNDTYISLGRTGDFNILLLAYSFINILFLTIGMYVYEATFNILSILLVILISLFQLVRGYLLVSFRININYKGILFSNILLIIGYLLGMTVFLATGYWQTIYLAGEVMSLIYVALKTNLLKEPIKRTKLFKDTTKHSLVTLLASFLGTLNTQIDRLFLLPVLGPKMVAIYYISSLFGKTLSMCVAPINNVLLTYLSKMKKFSMSTFNIMVIVASILGVLCYVFIIIVSEPLLTFLYPNYAKEALELIYITTLTAIVTMLSTVINPIIMKFCNIIWQIWLNVINIITFIVLGFILINLYGIIGFCYAALLASIVKFIIMIMVYYRNSSNIGAIGDEKDI